MIMPSDDVPRISLAGFGCNAFSSSIRQTYLKCIWREGIWLSLWDFCLVYIGYPTLSLIKCPTLTTQIYPIMLTTYGTLELTTKGNTSNQESQHRVANKG
jgi:hypothetical protein